MRKLIVCLLLVASLGIIPFLLSAQQNQSAEKLEQKIEDLEKRISGLEDQLQAVENVEKLDLQAKLADANAKLAGMEFEKFERGLKDSNDEWLKGWSSWFLGIIAIFVAILLGVSRVFWFWLRSRADRLITDEVGKNLSGFRKAVDTQNAIKDQLGVLEKQYAASMLASVIDQDLPDEQRHPEQIKAIREETLLQVFDDEEYYPSLKYKAAEVLAARKSPRLISPLLDRLNLETYSESDPFGDYNFPELARPPRWPDAVKFLADIQTLEAYEALYGFLNHLLTEDPKGKNLFIEKTVSSLVQVGIKSDRGDWVSTLTRAIPHLKDPSAEVLSKLVEYFDGFNEPASIKKILVDYLEDETHMDLPTKHLKDKCLELLQKHDPAFVEEWRAKETTNNSEA